MSVDEKNAETSKMHVRSFASAKVGDKEIAYLSGDMRTVTTLTFERIGDVYDLHKTNVGFGADGSPGVRYCFRMRAHDGRVWSGNGLGGGMFCRLLVAIQKVAI